VLVGLGQLNDEVVQVDGDLLQGPGVEDLRLTVTMNLWCSG
jgi:hypothetical protein